MKCSKSYLEADGQIYYLSLPHYTSSGLLYGCWTSCPLLAGCWLTPKKAASRKSKEQLGLWHECEKVEVWPDMGWLEMAVSGLCNFIECPEQMFFTLPIIHYHLCLLSPLFLALKKLKCIVRVEFSKLIVRPPGKAPDVISFIINMLVFCC